MASCSTSFVPLPAEHPTPCPNPGLSLAGPSQCLPSRLSLSPTRKQPGGCRLPPAGPLFPRPMPQKTGSFPGSRTQSSRRSFTMVDTTTTPSASVASRDVAGSPFSTVPAPASIMTDKGTQAASPNWTSRQGPVEHPPCVAQSASLNPPSQLSATRHSPARPLVPPLPGPDTLCRQLPSTQASMRLRKSSSTSKFPRLESMSTLREKPLAQKIVPSSSIDEYNRSVSACPGSVYCLRVKF